LQRRCRRRRLARPELRFDDGARNRYRIDARAGRDFVRSPRRKHDTEPFEYRPRDFSLR
jgi:hypothetical protein